MIFSASLFNAGQARYRGETAENKVQGIRVISRKEERESEGTGESELARRNKFRGVPPPFYASHSAPQVHAILLLSLRIFSRAFSIYPLLRRILGLRTLFRFGFIVQLDIAAGRWRTGGRSRGRTHVAGVGEQGGGHAIGCS